MRPEAKFSDGVPITAEDVVFTWQILLEKGEPSYQITLKDIENVEALDPHRVKFTFKKGASYRDLPSVAGGLAILPKHYYQDVDFAQSTLTPPVGSGQYVVAEANPGKSIKYCKNPDYWGKALPVNVGVNNFDCYVYQYFADITPPSRRSRSATTCSTRNTTPRSGPPATTSPRCRRAGSSAWSFPTTARPAHRASGSTSAARSCRIRGSVKRSG